MKSSKNKRTIILAIILLGLLIVAYRTVFTKSDVEDTSYDDNLAASERVEGMLREVGRINFDTAITKDLVFTSLKSISTPLIPIPVGRKDPFAEIFPN